MIFDVITIVGNGIVFLIGTDELLRGGTFNSQRDLVWVKDWGNNQEPNLSWAVLLVLGMASVETGPRWEGMLKEEGGVVLGFIEVIARDLQVMM